MTGWTGRDPGTRVRPPPAEKPYSHGSAAGLCGYSRGTFPTSAPRIFMSEVLETANHHDVFLLIVRIAVLLLAARAFGEVARRMGQPAVVGEILAGVILGPSLLGGFIPIVGEWMVPGTQAESWMLEVVSLLGAMFLLIITGLETDIPLIRAHARTAVSVSLGGIAVTFTSGFLLASAMPDNLVMDPDKRLVFNLFVATAMSVSAIPVVAKVLMDLGLMRRTIGQTILASGMVDDTVAWTLLSIVLGIAAADQIMAGTLLFAGTKILLFLIVAFTAGRWLIQRALNFTQDRIQSPEAILSLVIVLAFLFGAVTQALGIEAVLGAFVVGIILGTLPRMPVRVVHQLEAITIGFFAPLFFAYAGLKVDLRSIAQGDLPFWAILVLAVAISGKYVGTYFGARVLGGKDHYSALAFGSGLNARGAVEIIIASIGLGAGILTLEMYSIIVMMAVVTSVMAPFGLRWALARVPVDSAEETRLKREALEANNLVTNARRVLVPVRLLSESEDGPAFAALKGLERHLLNRMPSTFAVTLLTVVSSEERGRAARFLAKLREGFDVRELEVKLVVSDESPRDIILAEARCGYGLLVLGATRIDSEDNLFNPVIDELVRMSPCPVMVARGAIDEKAWQPSSILVPTNGTAASLRAAETAFSIAQAEGPECRVTALYVVEGSDDPFGPRVTRPAQSLALAEDIVGTVASLGAAMGITVDTRIRHGVKPSRIVLEEAESGRVDLIVVGTDLRPGTRRLHLGREVERIFTGAPCPVLVVNAGDGG